MVQVFQTFNGWNPLIFYELQIDMFETGQGLGFCFFNEKFTKFGIIFAIFNMKFGNLGIEFTIFNMKVAEFDMKCATYDIKYSEFDIRVAIFNFRIANFNVEVDEFVLKFAGCDLEKTEFNVRLMGFNGFVFTNSQGDSKSPLEYLVCLFYFYLTGLNVAFFVDEFININAILWQVNVGRFWF